MANESLSAAKAAKNDEFYTQYYDIEREINAYLDFDPDVFRGKTVLLPCDDPEWSNFTLYFAQHFQTLGLKRLISTSYAPDSKKFKTPYLPSLFEQDAPQFDPSKTCVKGKIFELDQDIDGNGCIDFHDLEWRYLDGDGDFRSHEVTRLRDEADIIVTNPPFSLFREFLAWIVEADKKFIIIGNMNAITYKEVFPMIMKIKFGSVMASIGETHISDLSAKRICSGVKDDTTGLVKFRNCCWFTNLDHGRRHQPLSLMTMEENIMYSKHKEIRGKGYAHYDNYDAIEVPYTDAIPSDYNGAMGVPITFLDKYCPDQFEILGQTQGDSGKELGVRPYPRELKELNPSLRDGQLYYLENGIPQKPYARVLIRRLK